MSSKDDNPTHLRLCCGEILKMHRVIADGEELIYMRVRLSVMDDTVVG
jgi:hypothetical protein